MGQSCNIVCTEPRRISAISLARRVSEEMGEAQIGSQESVCGYQIRFESKRGPATRLIYCTTGVILRQLQMDPGLKDVSHIIVDEVKQLKQYYAVSKMAWLISYKFCLCGCTF